MAKTTADVLVERLRAWGVEVVFGLPGDGINGFMEGMRKTARQIRFIQVRTRRRRRSWPAGTPSSPAGWASASPPAAPGAIHLLNGLYDAKMDGAPVLAITGPDLSRPDGHALPAGSEPPRPVRGRHGLQPADQRPASTPRRLVDAACRAALSCRGVAHLNCPNDWQDLTTRILANDGRRVIPRWPGGRRSWCPQAESLKTRRRDAQRRQEDRHHGRAGGPRRGRRRSRRWPTPRRRRSSRRCSARPSCPTTARTRPAAWACWGRCPPRRRWRSATRCSWSARASPTWPTCPSRARPRPSRSTATRRGWASAIPIDIGLLRRRAARRSRPCCRCSSGGKTDRSSRRPRGG